MARPNQKLFLLVLLACLSCQQRAGVPSSGEGTVRDQVPLETPRQFLPHLSEMDLPKCRFPNETGNYMHVTRFVQPWEPYASTLFGAWRAVVERVSYDKYKLYSRWYAQSPVYTWQQKRGICIDTAILLCAWLLKQRENAFVALGDTGELKAGHAWVLVRDSKKKETLLLETAIDDGMPPSAVRRLPKEEEY